MVFTKTSLNQLPSTLLLITVTCDKMGTMAAKRYADDYETVITTDEKGNEKKTAVYRGEYFEISPDEEGLAQFKRNCLLLVAAIIVLHISGGFVNNPGMNQFYVGLPYVSAFFPLVYLAMSFFRLPKSKPRYRRDEVGLSLGRMKTSSSILLVFLILSLLGEIAFLLFATTGYQLLRELLYLALAILTAAVVYYLIRLQGQIHILSIVDGNKNHMP